MNKETTLVQTMSFGLRYRCLSTEAKTLLSLVNRECGFAIAAELLQHLFRCKYDDVDDGFWQTVDDSVSERIRSIAFANRFTTVGFGNIIELNALSPLRETPPSGGRACGSHETPAPV